MRFEESVLSSVNSVVVSDSAMIRERISNSVRSEDSTLLSVNDFVSVAFTMSIEAPPPPPPVNSNAAGCPGDNSPGRIVL